jgi:serine protease Do
MGLAQSMSMGVVSNPDRRISDDDPVLYIQTDAPINPGNSGGALVDTQGRLVGLNTFILSQSGGSEGLGFAIPARVVQYMYEQFLKFGRVRRGVIGLSTQDLSPELIDALSLSSRSGVLVNDVAPDSPAEQAGLKVGDVIVTANGVALNNHSQLQLRVYVTAEGQSLKFDVMRGARRMTVDVVATERADIVDRLPVLPNPATNLIEPLGVLALDVTEEITAMMSHRRLAGGVLVVARVPSVSSPWIDLEVGDVIQTLNNRPINSVVDLKNVLGKLPPGSAVALQVERAFSFRFVTFRTN